MGYLNASDIMDAPATTGGGREISPDEMVDRVPKKPLAEFLFDELLAKPAKSIVHSATVAGNFLAIPAGRAFDIVAGGDRGVDYFSGQVEHGLRGLEENAPSPELGKVGRFARGVVEMAPKVAAGPAGLGLILAESATVRPAQMIDAGATPTQAGLASGMGLTTATAMTQMPLPAPTVAGTILKGGARNVGAGVIGRAGDAGAQKLTGDDRFAAPVFDAEAMGHDFAFGAGFGLHARSALIKAGIDPATITTPMIEQKAIELASKIPSKIPYTKANIDAKAAKFFDEGYIGPKGEGTVGEALPTRGPSAEATDAAQGLAGYEGGLARNAAQSRELLDRVAKGSGTDRATLTPTYAQETGGRLAATREQAMSAQDPAMGVRMTNTDAKINEAAVKNLRNAVGPEQPPVAVPRTPVETGRNIISEIEAAKAPVRRQMDALQKEIPVFEMRADETGKAIKEATKLGALSDAVPAAMAPILDSFNRRAPNGLTTTELLHGLRRTVQDAAYEAGVPSVRVALQKIVRAIDADFNNLGSSGAGETVIHKGQAISVNALAKELESNLLKMADVRKTLDLDYTAMRKKLADAGVHNREYLSADGGRQGLINSMRKTTEAYEKAFPGEPPPTAADTTGTRGVEYYQRRNAEIRAILEAAPNGKAINVGAAIKAYNKYANEEWFGRFDKGSTRDVTAKGNEASGLRVPHEQVAGKFWGESDARGLIRAVGLEAAREGVRPHMVQDMLKSSTVGVEGRIDVVKAAGWIKKNQAVLDAYGLTDSAKEIARGQLRDHIERKFEDLMTNPITGDPQSTINKMQKMRNELAPILRFIGYDQKAVQGLADYYAVLKMLGRNKNVSYAGGPTTAEKLMGLYGSDKIPGMAGKLVSSLSKDVIGAMIGFAGGTATGEPGGGGYGVAGGLAASYGASKVEAFHQSKAKIFSKVLMDAIYDPNQAHALIMSARSNGKNPTAKAVITQAIFNAAASVMRTLKDQRGMVGSDIGIPPITPQIKRWFGDSKVVDKDGNPLLVYHGTNAEFTKFNREKTPGGLIWFSADKSSIERGDSGASGNKFIMPAYLKVKKMAGWDEYDKLTIDQLIQQGYDGIKLDDDYVVFDNKQVKLAK